MKFVFFLLDIVLIEELNRPHTQECDSIDFVLFESGLLIISIIILHFHVVSELRTSKFYSSNSCKSFKYDFRFWSIIGPIHSIILTKYNQQQK